MVKLEEGKYYRTRDGQKVGPAQDDGSDVYPWNVPLVEGPFWYDPNGKSCIDIRSDDIVAEWEEGGQ